MYFLLSARVILVFKGGRLSIWKLQIWLVSRYYCTLFILNEWKLGPIRIFHEPGFPWNRKVPSYFFFWGWGHHVHKWQMTTALHHGPITLPKKKLETWTWKRTHLDEEALYNMNQDIQTFVYAWSTPRNMAKSMPNMVEQEKAIVAWL